MQEAAGSPDEANHPLAEPFARAGRELKTAREMSPNGDPDATKVKEQKQYTALIENHIIKALRQDFKNLPLRDVRRAAFFAVNIASRQFLTAWPSPECAVTSDEFQIIAARYFGTECPACAPFVGKTVQTTDARGRRELDAYGKHLVNAKLGNKWRTKHDAFLRAVMRELHFAAQDPEDNVYSLFARFFEGDDRARAWVNGHDDGAPLARKQGLVPDIHVRPGGDGKIVDRNTLYELKQINLVADYFRGDAAKGGKQSAAHRRGDRCHPDYCFKLHLAEVASGLLECNAPKTNKGICSKAADTVHAVGRAEQHLLDSYDRVMPLVFGHFGEFNDTLLELIKAMATQAAELHHRTMGWSSPEGGIAPCKAGMMRRLGMEAARVNAQHVLSALGHVGPATVRAHDARVAQHAARYDEVQDTGDGFVQMFQQDDGM